MIDDTRGLSWKTQKSFCLGYFWGGLVVIRAFCLCILMSNKSFWFFGFYSYTLQSTRSLQAREHCFISRALVASDGC